MAKVKRFRAMADAEKAAVVSEFEQPGFVPRPSGKMPPALVAAEKRVRAAIKKEHRGPGRPTVGAGAERVTTSIERGLLKEVDAFAKDKGLSRAEMIAHGLRLVMGLWKTSEAELRQVIEAIRAQPNPTFGDVQGRVGNPAAHPTKKTRTA